MATRTIVTSQPDVECDVCARRLLRGEQPDVFIGAGRRRIVCELCAPRAALEGWLRETDSQSLALPPARPRRGRSLFERLSTAFKAREQELQDEPVEVGMQVAGEPAQPLRPGPQGPPPQPVEPRSLQAQPYDALADLPPVGATEAPPVPAPEDWGHGPGEEAVTAMAAPSPHSSDNGAGRSDPQAGLATASYASGAAIAPSGASETRAAPAEPSAYLREAIEVFNAGAFPRRVAGVIRSLGSPLVNVRSAEHLASVVRIVVAWELCWYRYEVDLSELEATAEVIAQGSELAELPREDRIPNATAGDKGMLALAAM